MTQPATPTPTQPAPSSGDCNDLTIYYGPNDGTGVTPAQFCAWDSVAQCEEANANVPGTNGWDLVNYQHGPGYFGNLGESSALWDSFPQYNRTSATPDEQIVVGLSVVGAATPDQGYCASW